MPVSTGAALSYRHQFAHVVTWPQVGAQTLRITPTLVTGRHQLTVTWSLLPPSLPPSPPTPRAGLPRTQKVRTPVPPTPMSVLYLLVDVCSTPDDSPAGRVGSDTDTPAINHHHSKTGHLEESSHIFTVFSSCKITFCLSICCFCHRHNNIIYIQEHAENVHILLSCPNIKKI